ncbi:NB-ARC-like protein, partial [Cynara cardunculus var. scolymus]
MAELILGAIMDVLFQKLASGDLLKLARSEGIHSQLDKWNNTLLQIQALLVDAANKHITDRAIDFWLRNLQDLAYQIDDILDDLATEAIRRKLNKDSHASSSTNTGKLRKLIPGCCTNFTPHTIVYGHKMSSKLDKITTKLHTLFDQKHNLGLDVNVKRPNRRNRRLEETSLVDVSKVMGREGDKEALLHRLLWNEACNQNVSIVSVVGLGGIGKTTLAKLVYNEKRVKDHFELRAWVCVSEEFDVFNISKAIFQAVAGTNQEFANLDLLHV